jgi:hypothetical protein
MATRAEITRLATVGRYVSHGRLVGWDRPSMPAPFAVPGVGGGCAVDPADAVVVAAGWARLIFDDIHGCLPLGVRGLALPVLPSHSIQGGPLPRVVVVKGRVAVAQRRFRAGSGSPRGFALDGRRPG